MFNKVKVKILFSSAKKSAFGLLTTATVFTQIACKNDDDAVGNCGLKTDPTVIIPTKGKTYTYQIKDEDGSVATQITRVKNVRDSSGIAVYDIKNKISGYSETVFMMKSFSKSSVTTNEINLPAAL